MPQLIRCCKSITTVHATRILSIKFHRWLDIISDDKPIYLRLCKLRANSLSGLLSSRFFVCYQSKQRYTSLMLEGLDRNTRFDDVSWARLASSDDEKWNMWMLKVGSSGQETRRKSWGVATDRQICFLTLQPLHSLLCTTVQCIIHFFNFFVIVHGIMFNYVIMDHFYSVIYCGQTLPIKFGIIS